MFPKETNILVVDDSIHMRRLITDTLYQLGFRKLVSASDANEAINLMGLNQKNKDPFQLILSDLNMPGINGLEFLKQIRATELYASMPFILITTESEKKYVLDAAVNGVSSYIVKPFTTEALANRMLEAWKKHNPD